MAASDRPKPTADDVRREASRYLAYELGDLLWPGEATYDEAANEWRVPIHSQSLPRDVVLDHLKLDATGRVRNPPSRQELERIAQRSRSPEDLPIGPGARFYDGFLTHGLMFAAASKGELVLVADAGIQIPVALIAGPEVDREGQLFVTIAIERDDLDRMRELSETFLLDVLFIPALEVLCTVQCGADEMRRLQSYDGLRITAPLPGMHPFLPRLRAALAQRQVERFRLPRRAFELRIRTR